MTTRMKLIVECLVALLLGRKLQAISSRVQFDAAKSLKSPGTVSPFRFSGLIWSRKESLRNWGFCESANLGATRASDTRDTVFASGGFPAKNRRVRGDTQSVSKLPSILRKFDEVT
jgi:hypothetical protein